MPTVLPGDNALAGARTVTIYNVTLASANTEYPQVLATNTRKFSMRPRTASHTIKVAFTSGESGTLYISVGAEGYSDDLIGVPNLTLYMQSLTAGAIVEIIGWS